MTSNTKYPQILGFTIIHASVEINGNEPYILITVETAGGAKVVALTALPEFVIALGLSHALQSANERALLQEVVEGNQRSALPTKGI